MLVLTVFFTTYMYKTNEELNFVLPKTQITTLKTQTILKTPSSTHFAVSANTAANFDLEARRVPMQVLVFGLSRTGTTCKLFDSSCR
jgi:hypothetical protein